MGRPQTKTDLITAASENYVKLNALVDSMTDKELSPRSALKTTKRRKKRIGAAIKICAMC